MNAYVTANGVPCFKADVVRPRIGNWHADLTVNANAADRFSDAVEIVLAETLTLKGTAHRMGVFGEDVYVRVIGGRGGFAVQLTPRGYTNVPARIPLSDCLREAGEVLSPSADPGVLQRFLPKWVRIRQTAGAELAALVAVAGAEAWRVLPDGSIWLGPETWAPAELEYDPIRFEPQLGRLEFAADVPTVHPGQTWVAPGEAYDGMRTSSIRHLVTAETIRHFAMFEEQGDGTDRLKAGLEAIFRTRLDPRIDAAACYWAKVIAQNADGTLELRPDSPKLPDLSKVPIRLGIPGTSVKVAAGARVVVEFADGDMTQPMATVWGTSSVTEITLGGSPNQPATLATALRTELDAIWTALQTHVHPGVTAGGATTGAPTVIKTAQTIASAVVKVRS